MQDGTKLLTCSADKSAKLLDLQTGQPAQQIAAHDAPISCVKWLEVSGQQVAVTAGWDKMVKVRRGDEEDSPLLTHWVVLGYEDAESDHAVDRDGEGICVGCGE